MTYLLELYVVLSLLVVFLYIKNYNKIPIYEKVQIFNIFIGITIGAISVLLH